MATSRLAWYPQDSSEPFMCVSTISPFALKKRLNINFDKREVSLLLAKKVQFFAGIIRLICSNQERPQMCFENSRYYLNIFHGVKVFVSSKPEGKPRTRIRADEI